MHLHEDVAGRLDEPAAVAAGRAARRSGDARATGRPRATYDEYHPAGTRYASDDAPIAPRHFPYNRCNVSRCVTCGRLYLRYQEGGGYFIDQRIRALDPALIVDAPAQA
jgi:hypothetical protein